MKQTKKLIEQFDNEKNIVQGTGKIVRIMEIFQLRSFGLWKISYNDFLGKIDVGFKYVPIRDRFGL